ncbi:MAG: hypothetical protein ACJ788_14310 [Ktedonobacteraceae bacterium]
MRVSTDAADCFITLYMRLLYYAGQRRDVLPPDMSFHEFLAEPSLVKIACREKIYEPWPLINDFLSAHGDTLSGEEQKTVEAWTRSISGTFVILRHLKKYTIFLHSTSPPSAYGVLGLTTDLEELLPKPCLPLSVKTVLLPYKGVVVCDGMLKLSVYDMINGPNMRSGLDEDYKNIKNAGRFFTVL